MPKIDINAIPERVGSIYPKPLNAISEARAKRRLGDVVGLTQFGVNLTRLPPGAASAHRHWHEAEDEFVYVLEGEVTLIEDEGETVLKAGDAAGFKAGVANGHHLVNKSDADVLFLEIGSRSESERGHYPEVDLVYEKRGSTISFTTKDGKPYD